MSVAKQFPDTDPDARSASILQELRGDTEVRVQPVPRALARIVPTGGRGIARDRLQLWSLYGRRFRQTVSDMARALPEVRSPQGRRPDDRLAVLADLAAVHLHLAEEWAWLDAALLNGTPGAHLPLARCVASGLRRLPAYRGPAIVRTSMSASLTDWYRENRVVVDQGFWSATASAVAVSEGGPGFLVWSLTGRRTGAVDPYTPERLVFLPGTRFKVLQVFEEQRPVVLMREMFPQEPYEHRRADSGSGHGEWLDESTVAEMHRAAVELHRAAAGPSVRPVELMGPRGRPPGLIVAK
ncbi:hypothetical protein [Streptomyces sp. NBC_01320]|uniref:hypothetical protein n=1 Tax=Streptomyces sp. NBC_01320 TaxID=2903824 RepID=UPI002E14D790|nr:hypothetical protein OG395_56255 [Streptomyces sp. NBC_01320]